MSNLYVVGRGVLFVYGLVYLLGPLWVLHSIDCLRLTVSIVLGIAGLAISLWPRGEREFEGQGKKIVAVGMLIFAALYIVHIGLRLSEPSSLFLEVLITEGAVIAGIGLIVHEISSRLATKDHGTGG